MDLVKLRMQAMPTGNQIKQRYTSSLHAYRSILKDDGFTSLWKGTDIFY